MNKIVDNDLSLSGKMKLEDGMELITIWTCTEAVVTGVFIAIVEAIVII